MNGPVESRTSYSLAVVAVGTALVVLFAGTATIVALGHTVPQAMWAAASALSGALVGILIPTSSGVASPDRVAAAATSTKAAATSAARTTAAAITEPEHSKQAATAALASVKAAPVEAKVAQSRGEGTSAAEVIDHVVAIFEGLHTEAQRISEAAREALRKGQQEGDLGEAELRRQVDRAQAGQTVKEAAVNAARGARPLASEIASTGSAPPPPPPSRTAGKQSVLLFALAGMVLVGAVALALLIATGQIHAANCPLADAGKTESCDSNVLQIGTVVLSLASAAGGTLLGLFATPDGKPPTASTTSLVAR
jgi:hypothetical protein